MVDYNRLPKSSEFFSGKLYDTMRDDLQLAGLSKRTVYGYLRASASSHRRMTSRADRRLLLDPLAPKLPPGNALRKRLPPHSFRTTMPTTC